MRTPMPGNCKMHFPREGIVVAVGVVVTSGVVVATGDAVTTDALVATCIVVTTGAKGTKDVSQHTMVGGVSANFIKMEAQGLTDLSR